MAADSVVQTLLEARYLRNGSQPVAFIDETMRTTKEQPNEFPFYLFTAVLIDPINFDQIRHDIHDISGSEYWHTTENLSSDSGRQKILEMLNYLNRGNEISVISLFIGDSQTYINSKQLRKETLTKLFHQLFAVEQISLAVLEKRNSQSLIREDERTLRVSKQSGMIPRSAQIFQCSPAEERLLWLPDLVCSAKRQELIRNDSRYLSVIREKILEIRV
jgi:hypothetical protein